MDDDVTRAWLAGAEAARAADVAALRARLAAATTVAEARAMTTERERTALLAALSEERVLSLLIPAVEGMPLPAPPAPPQSPLPSSDAATPPQGDGAPAGGCGVAEAYVDAAGVCERMAQTHDRLAAAADEEGVAKQWRGAAAALHLAADRIRGLAGGP